VKKLRHLLFKFASRLLLGGIAISLLLVLPFRWLNPPMTMVMADRWISSDSPSFRLQKKWLDWEDIPKQAALAVVTSEDQLFPSHVGFDFKAIWSVIRSIGKKGQLRGASTISQQVARNMYLWTGRSWFRKGLEVWFTVLIEMSWGKQRILEVYLNIAEWGEGVFGLEAASRYHFKKPASSLRPMQQALLASSLPSPLTYDPAYPAEHLFERARWNLVQQQKLGGVGWLSSLEEQ
jgi:monofunctional biosynthetic peptidoglycan transglycosylase